MCDEVYGRDSRLRLPKQGSLGGAERCCDRNDGKGQASPIASGIVNLVPLLDRVLECLREVRSCDACPRASRVGRYIRISMRYGCIIRGHARYRAFWHRGPAPRAANEYAGPRVPHT